MTRAALIATALAPALGLATPAAADLRLTGEARMGLRADDSSGAVRTGTATSTTLVMELSRETSNGLRLSVTTALSDGRMRSRGPRD